jgi:hypothetical protein
MDTVINTSTHHIQRINTSTHRHDQHIDTSVHNMFIHSCADLFHSTGRPKKKITQSLRKEESWTKFNRWDMILKKQSPSWNRNPVKGLPSADAWISSQISCRSGESKHKA